MNPKNLIKLGNRIGTIAIILLLYWVFINITVSVLGLKVFEDRLSEIFYMSLWGIFALMFGALILNVMLNLSRIADKHNDDPCPDTPAKTKKPFFLFSIGLLLISGLLGYGDYWTSHKKERFLIASAQSIVENNTSKVDELLDYSFDRNWIIEVSSLLDIPSRTDENFPYISIIQKDSIQDIGLFLAFKNYHGSLGDTILPLKKEYIFTSTEPEREYLEAIFESRKTDIRFSAAEGQYELFYPYQKEGKKMIIYFSDQQSYGSFGK